MARRRCLQGRAAALERMQSLIELVGPIEVRLEELIDRGRWPLHCLHEHGREGAHAPYTQSFAVLHRLRDGLIVEADDYLDRAQALEAAGLSE